MKSCGSPVVRIACLKPRAWHSCLLSVARLHRAEGASVFAACTPRATALRHPGPLAHPRSATTLNCAAFCIDTLRRSRSVHPCSVVTAEGNTDDAPRPRLPATFVESKQTSICRRPFAQDSPGCCASRSSERADPRLNRSSATRLGRTIRQHHSYHSCSSTISRSQCFAVCGSSA